MKKMKLISALLALITAASVMAGCAGNSSDTTADNVVSDVTGADTDKRTEQDTETEAPETYDPALDDSGLELDGNGNVVSPKTVDPGLLVGTDGLGRTLLTNAEVGGVRDDKTVGIFYSSWHGTFYSSNRAVNNQQILDKYPDIEKNNYNDARWSTAEAYHFWNEPIYGYYSGNDEWVLRHQAELLADAGVDCVICDNTNGAFTWATTAIKMMKVFHEAREDGVNAPTVTFLLPFGPTSGTKAQLLELYEKIYKDELYPDSWTMWEGKPLMIGYKSVLDRKDETQAAISKMFTWREPVADYVAKQTVSKQWGWLSVYPQTTYKAKVRDEQVEQITVGVAQNHNWKSHTITAMNGDNVTDRTYTSHGYDTRDDAVLYGANFEEQFEYALEVDPKFIFITGWNEWVALRLSSWNGVTNAFVDQYNDRASRDIEPSKGNLKDHYYYQMVNFIRRYKGVNAQTESSGKKTIDIYGGYGQWANVLPEYNSYSGNVGRRASYGYLDAETGAPLRYADNSGRNDIYDAKVARDNENLYFMVRCVSDITPYTDENWMRLYLDTSDSEKNWETFEFVLNKTAPKDEHTAILEAFTGSGFETVTVGEVEYNVSGNVLAVKIPRSMLGIQNSEFTVDFKWADNSADGDIMDFYTKGDAAPGGRFKFRYKAD